jgi:pimeloyl-ACP methyl ester carboxylesterase
MHEARTTEAEILFVAARLPRHLPAGLPVLHIWGAKDPSATPGVLSMMREIIAGLEVIELPDQGHWIMAGAKEEVSRAVLRWLAKWEVKKARL